MGRLIRECPVCSFAGELGPSDHEPWCPCFMRGAVDLEGEQQLPFELGPPTMGDEQDAARLEAAYGVRMS